MHVPQPVHVAELVLHLGGHVLQPVHGAELALVDRLDAHLPKPLHGKKVLNLLSLQMLLTRLSMTKEMTLYSFTAQTT